MPLAPAALAPLATGEVQVDAQARRVTVPVQGGARVLPEALRRLDAEGVAILDVGLRRPTLDDVFLALTGHASDDAVRPDSPARTLEEHV